MFLNKKLRRYVVGHIHIGTSYLTNIEAYRILVELWGNCEYLLYIISNEESTLPREGIKTFAAPNSNKIEEVIEKGEMDLKNEEDLESFVTYLKNTQKRRYAGINFCNLYSIYNSKDTIEFRLPNGTINPDTWIENINLFGGIVKVAEEISIILTKSGTLSDREKRILELYENIRNGQTSETEKLEALLELAINEKERETYIERYNQNRKIIEKSPIGDFLRSNTSKGGIKLRPEDIGQVALIGKNAISSKEYLLGRSVIEGDLRARQR